MDAAAASIFDVSEASRDVCRLVWVVGWSAQYPPARMLSRFGDVVDVSSMSDEDAVEGIVGERLDGVVVFNDAPLRLAAAVADRLGLPFHSPRCAVLLTDKWEQRTALRAAGVAVPAFQSLSSDTRDVAVPFPAVLKPRVGAGGRDTYYVQNADEMVDVLRRYGRDDEFILEEFLADRVPASRLAADIVSVESVVRGGTFEHVAVTGRFPFAEPFRETGLFLPSDVSEEEARLVCDVATDALMALSVKEGITHTEVKLTPSGPRLIEVNGRLGGGVSSMIAKVGGPSLLEGAIRLALAQGVRAMSSLSAAPVAFYRFIVAPVGARSVASVSGIEALGKLPGVESVRLNRAVGEAVDSTETSHLGHVVRIDGVAASHEALDTLINELIPATLQVTWN